MPGCIAPKGCVAPICPGSEAAHLLGASWGDRRSGNDRNGDFGLSRTLIIGFGNVYRRDDGVAFVVLNAVRERLGRPLLDTEDDGFDDLGHEVDTILLH